MRAWESNIRRVSPYVPGEQPNLSNMIKLNTNENPYPPAPAIRNMLTQIDTDVLRLYPDPDAKALVKELANFYQVNDENVFVGVGSDDVIAMAFLTFFNSKKPILFPDITYSFYDVWADLYRIPYERPALDQEFRIRKEDYYKENGGVVIANPNAPTSIAEGIEVIEDILIHNQDVIVIVDEAYVDFGAESAISLTKKYENLLVIQTFSKSRSMAGMRIGYAIGNKDLIKALNDVKSSYNSYTMNQISILFGTEAVRDTSYFYQCIEKIIETREYVKEELKKLGFLFPDSKTNFLFITHKDINAKDLFLALREQGIFVRYFDKPRIDNYLRVTIGTYKQMQVFIDFVKQYCENYYKLK
ncbi:histidinol-phosphate transaminase [Clostridium sp. Marseille-P299]|uniref:histidinol-phosphate transaminase n=1 Tax=Clostridium sp. Marseille-P299 TaxID=1805477 RepID=UPI000829BD61|nr:histidinol-phosphate transaminase [Clostridium sp. Marseille-P299]